MLLWMFVAFDMTIQPALYLVSVFVSHLTLTALILDCLEMRTL